MRWHHCVIVCVLALLWVTAATWLLGDLAPQHPPILDKLLWMLAVVIVSVAVWLSDIGHPHG